MGSFLDNLRHDIRISLRILARRPLFTSVAGLTLAVGIGASTLIFSIFSNVIFRPLPYPESDRLVGIYRIEERVTGLNPSPSRLAGLYAVPFELYLDWKRMGRAFRDVGTYAYTSQTITGGEQPERLLALRADSGVFSTLGIDAALGRVFISEDDQIGTPALTVLSHRLWARRFGSEPDILGQEIVLSGIPHTIVGVMPEEFYFPSESAELWITFNDGQKSSTYRAGGYLQTIARLSDGVPMATAQIEMDGVALRLGELHPEEREHGVGLVSRKTLVVSNSRTVLVFFLGAVGLILLITCANIAGLLLVRTMEREKEIAVRAALGSGRARIVMQALTESILISVIGGVLGGIVAGVGLRPFIAAFPGGIPRSSEIAIDTRFLIIAFSISLLAGLLTGMLPALRSARTSLADAIGRSARGATGGLRQSRSHAVLVVLQVAIAFTLLVGAGLLVRSYGNLTTVDLGFEPESMLATRIRLPNTIASDVDEVRAFYSELEYTLRSIPGVEEVGIAVDSPFMPGMSFPPISVETSDGLVEVAQHRSTANPSYFKTMGIPILAGRGFTDADGPDSEPVIVVNEAMAQRYWPEEGALGRRIQVGSAPDVTWITVVGVVGNAHYFSSGYTFPEYYYPFTQDPNSTQNLHIKTAIDPLQLVEPVREAIWSTNPDIPLQINQMEELIRNDPGRQGPLFGAHAITLLAIVAGILALIGIYGTLAFSVTRRTREIGIRIALGARKESVIRNILVRGLALACIGLILGLGIWMLGGTVLRATLYGISPSDPVTIGQVSLVLLASAGAAALLPAYRATRVDPIEALRQE